ncbi:KAP-like P-loop domain-containing protein [Vibrio crassostreae]|uniref:KAP family P-loop NTPase fold protein n=1 Tax=Vibrio TaxID=662 RepID=UPI0009777232|nr:MULTISPECIES: KAP family NTPase [Vibrio]OMO22311.1 NTPase [Vibrio lentus]ROO70425.1 KAP-like P-loop domain-containing protein [Vibrio crassostreae]ROP08646.1 KAP-like P-loop domain-containing protein [Vibrio crassostreae]RPE91444.1 KAP-like P-loop domain-containing protein [Vibrio crassostreae]RPF14721.1 KAP-like P-loop domain-containing protein [Vibrio crassostreae]
MSNGFVSFDWSSSISSCDSPFPADTLNRKKYAEFLHNYLVSNAASGGYVLNLNAKWGAGKTYFINRWIDSIKDTHPVVYVDAWKQDYSDDPMLTVVSSLLGALSSHLPPENQRVANISEKSARFIKALAPALMKGVVKKATGVNLDDITFEEEGTQQDDEQKDSGVKDIVAESASLVAKCMIDEHNDKLEAVKHLRNEIKQLVEAVIALNDQLQAPAFVFIDELDRCRPSYAVEMLEVVKHFFELDNIVFVIATDTEQLQHAVKAVYGEGFDAQTYLGRFFRRRYSLTELSRYDFVQQIVESRVTYNSRWSEHVPSIHDWSDLTSVISIVADRFRLELRETEQLTDKFIAVLSNTSKTMNPYLLLILFVLRDKHYALYESWMEEVNKNHNFSSDVGSTIKYEIGCFNVYLKSWDKGFLLGENILNCEEEHNLKLYQLLGDMNQCCTYWQQGQKREYIRDLNNNSMQSYSVNIKSYNLLKERWVNLTATKTDYKNWVELAVSFDD